MTTVVTAKDSSPSATLEVPVNTGASDEEHPMKAIVQHEYGSPAVLALEDIARPAIGDDEVRVRVRAASVNTADWIIMRGVPLVIRAAVGLRRPRVRVRGTDVAGTVEAVGRNVTQLHPDDEVFGSCEGAFAEYVCAPEDHFVTTPAGLTAQQAAALPMAGRTALQGLRDAGAVQPGQKVLINGASGGVGTFAVQIARSLGAEVTGVCSTRNVELVRSLGADHVIDYTREDFTRTGRRYDLILDNVASQPLSDCRRALTPEGIFLPNNGTRGGRWFGPLGRMLWAALVSPFVSQTIRPFSEKPTRADLVVLKELAEEGKVTPVIERTYPLGETPAALAHLGDGHTRGKVVITV
jgi:NADPH:quinone reductase-like Zn-dependent oxidoreductase